MYGARVSLIICPVIEKSKISLIVTFEFQLAAVLFIWMSRDIGTHQNRVLFMT